MTKLTSEDIERMADEARDEIDKKYGLDDFYEQERNDKNKVRSNKTKHKRRKSKRVIVRNNHKRIGEADVFLLNFKKVMVATGIAGLVVVSFAAGRASKETKIVSYTYNVLSENYFREPTYNGVEYVVRAGDNVWSIVRKYQEDESEVAELVDDIVRLNKIYDRSLQVGEKIMLVGVPSSKLYLFNYTDNYNLLDPIVEVKDRIDFLNQMKEDLSENAEAIAYLVKVDNVLDDWDSYKYSYIPGEESDEFDIILTDIREACEEAREFGYDYEYYKNCFPISVVPEQELTPNIN